MYTLLYRRIPFQSIVAFALYAMIIVASGLLLPKQWIQIAFFLYSFFVFWIVWRSALHSDVAEQDDGRLRRFFVFLFLLSVLFFIVTRLLPFVRYGATPLGYDTGFYLQSIESALSSAEDVIGGITGHRLFRSLLWFPFLWLRVSPVLLLHGSYLLFQALMLGALYMVARALSLKNRFAYASILLFLFSVSVPQFYAFWWMFYQTALSLAFLLFALAFLHRRSLLAFVAGGFGAAVHPATFFGFGIALGIFAILSSVYALLRRRFPEREIIFLLILGALAIFFIRRFGQEFVLVYLRGSVNAYGWFITQYPEYLREQFTGLYINKEFFHFTILYLLPFSALGILLFLFRKMMRAQRQIALRFFFLLIFLFVLSVLAYFPFLYQNRYLIYLDLVLSFFAVYPLMIFFHALSSHWSQKIVIGLLLFGFFSYNAYAVWMQRPQIYPDELREIKMMAQLEDEQAYAMVTEPMYTPWVSYFSRRRTIDPGYLTYNLWTHQMWREFWFGKSDVRRRELLRMYDRPIYLFIGRRASDTMAYKKFIFRDPHFVRLSRSVWKYDPRRDKI